MMLDFLNLPLDGLGVEPNQFTIDVDQRSAAIAGINRRIGLNEYQGAVGIRLARDGGGS